MKKVQSILLLCALLGTSASAQENIIRLTATASTATVPITISTKALSTITLVDSSIDELFASDTELLSIDEAKNGNLLIKSKKSTGETDLHIYTSSGQTWIFLIKVGNSSKPVTYELTGVKVKTNETTPTGIIPTSKTNTTPSNATNSITSKASSNLQKVQEDLKKISQQENKSGRIPAAPATANIVSSATTPEPATAKTPKTEELPKADLFGKQPEDNKSMTTNTASGTTEQTPTQAPMQASANIKSTRFDTSASVEGEEIHLKYSITAGDTPVGFDPNRIQVNVAGKPVAFYLTRVGGNQPRVITAGQTEEGTVVLGKNLLTSDTEVIWVITDDQERTFKRNLKAK